MRRWLQDTLFKRLFVLMWMALVGSHIAAYVAVMTLLVPFERLHTKFESARLPTFPSLPPTPGVPDSRHAAKDAARAAGTNATYSPSDGSPSAVHRRGPPRLPTGLLILDYGVRLVLIAVAAWLGARWVSAPMRRLAAASRSLGPALGRRDRTLPRLDETLGSREVRDTARVFNEMASELDKQFRSRGLLMAAISHDLRTPLTRMRMRLEKLAEDPAAQRCIADIREMDELIESAFEIFRGADAGESTQSVDVLALVQALADDLIELGETITVDGTPPVIARAQPAALRRAVSNLLSNALRYGERARVSVAAQADAVRIVIEDSGPGIPEAQLEAVFEPFFRVESSRNRGTGGTGLGLYIARDLLSRQSARLSLSNGPHGGLRAEVLLPAR